MIDPKSTKFKIALWVSLIGAFVFIFSILPDVLRTLGAEKMADSKFVMESSELANVIYPYVVPSVLIAVGLLLFAIPVLKMIGFGMLTIGFVLIFGIYLSRLK